MTETLRCPKCSGISIATTNKLRRQSNARLGLLRWCQTCRAEFSLSEARQAQADYRAFCNAAAQP